MQVVDVLHRNQMDHAAHCERVYSKNKHHCQLRMLHKALKSNVNEIVNTSAECKHYISKVYNK